jgi:carboxyl-terminal processing protease
MLTAGAAVALLISSAALAEEKPDSHAETYEMLNLFGDVFERVRSDYVEEASDEELIEAAVNGMLSSLDPHSGYLNAKSYGEMKVQTHGSFGGLGIEVTMEGGLVKVVSPIDDTPAFRAGLQPGDLVTHIDGEQVLGLTLSEAVEKMRGPVDTKIELTIRREGQDPFDVTITRAIVKIQSVRSRLEGKVGYIRVSSFSEQTGPGITAEIEKLREEAGGTLQGIVLDLRNNPGGLLSQAIAVSDAFLEKGEIVSTRSRRPGDAQRFNARPGDVAAGLPLVVIINAGSASASEIVAGALQDHGRAILLGTKSFGKGSVQTIIPLGSRGAMRLTTARYYTPSGRSIQAVGIEPDIIVEQARIEMIDAPKRRREADLRGALDKSDEVREEGKDSGGTDDQSSDSEGAEDTEAEATAKDYQLLRALDLVRGLSLFANKVSTSGG